LSLNDEIVAVSVHERDPEFSGDTMTGSSQMPLAIVSCANCAHVMFFAAGTIGMVQHGIETPFPGVADEVRA
jgi:hypothetical protein